MPVNGPSGGSGGFVFNDEPVLEAGTRVARIVIRTGQVVDSVEITHIRPNNTLLTLPHHGGFGGVEQPPLDLGAGERITQIEGRYGEFVDFITVSTNQGRVLSGGGGGGVDGYIYQAPTGFEIVGFFGRSGSLVDAIGIVLRAI